MIVDAGLNSINVSLEVPSDEDGFIREDIIGMRVYVSESPITNGSPTTLKYDGGSLSTTIVGLKGGQQYYVAAAYMSAFCGSDFPDSELTLVSVAQVTTLKAPGAISVQVERPSVLLIADSSGVVSSYSDSGTTIKVFDGPTELQYDGTGTSNGTWKVVASGTSITVGSLTDSGSFVTVGQHSAMTQDTAKVAYAISGVTSLGSSFSQTVYQALSKVRKGVRGWTIATIGAWSDASAAAAIDAVVTANGSSPTTLIKGDTVFYSGGAKQYTGSSWDTAANFIHGNLLVDGTIIGKNLAAEFSIQSNGKIIAGSSDSGVVLSSDGTVKVLEGGLTRAVMGKIGSSYGFQAYSPSGLKLFDSLSETAFIANIGKNNYLIGDYTTFPSYNDSGAGNYNIAIGGNTLTGAANAGRLYNVAIGHLALATGQGSYNVAIGDASQSGYDGANQTTGNYNTSVGVHSLFSLQSGDNNTAIGYNAGWLVTSGKSHLTLVGADSGMWITGGYSTCIGSLAGNTAEGKVTAVGYNAGATAKFGSVSVGAESDTSFYGTAVGYFSKVYGSSGVSIGYGASSTTDSISIGHDAGINANSSGSTIVGSYAGQFATGTGNAFFGYKSGQNNSTGTSNSFFGWLSGANSSGYSNTYFGQGAGENSSSGNNNVSIGVHAGRNSTGHHNILVGTGAGFNFSGSNSTIVGTGAGFNFSGSYSTIVGTNAGYYSTGNYVIAFGYGAGQAAGEYSSCLGSLTNAGLNSVAIGYLTRVAEATVAVGVECNPTANGSVVVGYQSGKTSTTAPLVAVGYQSGMSSAAAGNSFFGYQSGKVCTAGNNTLIGYQAGVELTTGEGNLFIGKGAGSSATTTNNSVVIGGFLTPSSNTLTLSLGDGTVRGDCDGSGNWKFTGKVGVKSGGSVTQITSRTTGVTLNKPSGEIVLFNASTTANQITTFTLTNSFIGVNDVVKVVQKSGTGLYFCHVTNVSSGSCKISVHTVAAYSAEAPKLSFIIFSGEVA